MKKNYQFRNNIWESISKFSYPVWVVKRFPTIKCTCIDPVTKEANPKCKKCLGLGTKIKLYKANATTREIKETEALNPYRTDLTTAKIIYFKYGALLEKDDIIVDNEFIFNILTLQLIRGEDGTPNAIKCVCPPMKLDTKIFLKNFNEVIAKGGRI